MKVIYFTNSYPCVSHTFIRAELLGLEKAGYSIGRMSIRRSNNLADPLDIEEDTKTTYITRLPRIKIASDIFRRVLASPLAVVRTFFFAMGLARRCDVPRFKMLMYFLEGALLAELCLRSNAGLVRVHFGTNGAIIARLARRLGGPGYSIAFHGPDEFDAPCRWDIGGIVAESDFVTAISSFCQAQVKRWTLQEYWDKIHTVPCAVASQFLDDECDFPESDARRLCIVARLSAQKGIPLLLEAFAEAVSSGASLKLDIVGDGEMREEVERTVRTLGLGENVFLHGSLSGAGVRAVLKKSHGFVLPSFAEGLPVVLMEAMAMGRPAITTAIAGIPELVRDGENGWLIPAGDKDAIVAALRAFSEIPREELARMGRAANSAVRSAHHIDVTLEKLNRAIKAHAGEN